MPCNGHNPHSVVIMDNGAIQHIQEIAAIIESAFSNIKLELQCELERPNTTDTETLLLQAFTSITPQNCRNWVYETGIYS